MTQKQKIIIVVSIFILVLLGLSIQFVRKLVSYNTKPPEVKKSEPTIVPVTITDVAKAPTIGQQSRQYQDAQSKVIQLEKPTIQAFDRVQEMKTKLPYKGKDFSIWYDETEYNFVIAYYKDDEKENGEKELKEFLLKNNISTIEALRNYRMILSDR